MVADLFVAIHLLSGYPVPERNPEVSLVPLATMQQMVCKGPSGVKGVYMPARGTFIDESIDLVGDIYARSVLMHELVHHLQHMSGKFETIDAPCYRSHAKEVEAYEIRNRYLKNMRVNRGLFSLDSAAIACQEHSKAASAGP